MIRKIDFEVDKETGCFVCTSHHTRNLYPQIKRNGLPVRMHRFVYEECFGEIPSGMCVCHRCDNCSCINPEHLFLGTVYDNNHDCYLKGRVQRGEDRPASKLTRSQVMRIRSSKDTKTKLAERYGVSRAAIGHVLNRKNWAWL